MTSVGLGEARRTPRCFVEAAQSVLENLSLLFSLSTTPIPLSDTITLERDSLSSKYWITGNTDPQTNGGPSDDLVYTMTRWYVRHRSAWLVVNPTTTAVYMADLKAANRPMIPQGTRLALVPMHFDQHWTLGIVDFGMNRVRLVDSRADQERRKRQFEMLVSLAQTHTSVKPQNRPWQLNVECTPALQEDDSGSGYIVIEEARLLADDQKLFLEAAFTASLPLGILLALDRAVRQEHRRRSSLDPEEYYQQYVNEQSRTTTWPPDNGTTLLSMEGSAPPQHTTAPQLIVTKASDDKDPHRGDRMTEIENGGSGVDSRDNSDTTADYLNIPGERETDPIERGRPRVKEPPDLPTV